MKKFCLSIFIILTQLISFGQSNEVEPNNSFATASPLLEADPTTATLDAVDTIDYHGLDFAYNANFYLILHIANTGTIGTQQLDLSIYNSLNVNGQYVGNFYSIGYQLNEGSSLNDTIFICGKVADSFYLEFKSHGEFEYTMEWYPVNAFEGDDLYYGYNNTPATASPFSFNIPKEASLGYEFWNDINYDTLDYFTTTLPAANYDSIGLTIQAQSNACSGLHGMQYFCYKNGNPTPFASGYVGNNAAVYTYQTVFTSIPLNNMQQGDVLLVKYTATSPFGYNFKYGVTDEFAPDIEDNCCANNAILLFENIAASGNVGEYDYNNDEFIDEYDTYRIILAHDGAVDLTIKARNDDCGEEYYTLTGDILDKYGNVLKSKDMIFWENYPACGEIQTDTIKLRGFSADTFYLRLHTDNSFYYGKVSYNMKYQFVDSTGSDANESYSSPITTVLPINAGETKKGHVRFWKTAIDIDASDHYHTTMPADGSITVYLKATHRTDYEGSNDNNPGRLTFVTSNLTGRTPTNPPVAFMTPDGIYLDTFHICGLGAGDLYFIISSGIAYEYEFRYEITDTSSLDNDVEPNNTFAEATTVAGGVTKSGHIRYVANVVTDTYDYYKMIYNGNDSLIIPLQATNTSCLSNRSVTFDGFNKNQSQIFSIVKSNVAPGQTVYDTVRISVTAPDTIYLQASATGAFKYQFSTNPKLPTSLFTITGDSAVCYGTTVYTAHNIGTDPVTYNWSLPLGGGSINIVDSLATVTWNGSGNRSVQLYLSNAVGNSQPKTRTVVVDSAAPSIAPAIINFARTLSISGVPPGNRIQWYRNNTIIANASDSSYYAALAGDYTARFNNNCGDGPVSNTYSFAANAIAQTISFPHTPNQSMALALMIKLPATASSGFPVYYTRISGPGTVISDSLSITGVGTIIIKASQPGDDNYSAATPKNDTIIVVKGNQVISFDSIPAKMYRVGSFTINATSSVGLTVTKAIISGNATISGSTVHLTGAGNITIRATQAGNVNYNAATPVDRTFCVGIDTLSAITGATAACLGTYTYRAQKITGANYVWTLSGGGTMTTNNDTAFVTWQTPGTHTLKVKANSSCNAAYSFEPQKSITINNVVPTAVSYMLPANGAVNQTLPLALSWVPGLYTETYDLYVWDSATAQPGTPYRANLTNISYTIPQSAFAYNTTYKWRIVSKNPCNQISGPIQTFRLAPLPDLTVLSVAAPTSAISGQTISISWTIKNNGPGATATNQNWQDAVYLSFDTMPNFGTSPEFNSMLWSALSFPVKPLFLGTRTNVMALQAGEQYSNSMNFNIPISYSLPVYAYVVTNSGYAATAIVELTKTNDTARAPNSINITLAPTPDLRVDSMFTPSSTFSGSVINIAYKVKNYGSLTPAGASWQDNAYLSQSILFDSSTAIKLKAPKSNGSYYPNTSDAGTSVNTQLQHDSAYYRNFQAVIPNNIFGTWFLHVKTNDHGSLYEGPSFNNNTNNNVVQVYLTPTPKLTINSLSVPVTQASTTQLIGVNWNIHNDGFNDNIEKNKGHYLYRVIGICSCPPGSSPPGSYCPPPPKYFDSLALGSSYWIDKVYLSIDSAGLNINNATLLSELKHGLQQFSGALYPDNMTGCSYGAVNVAEALKPGSNFPSGTAFTVPDTLQAGNYYIYVWTNPTKTVFEYPGTPEIKRTGALTIQRPDAVVSAIASPVNAIAGQPVQIDYAITNNGLGAVYNHIRRDKIYVSNAAVFDASAVLFATNMFTENLPVGTPVIHTANYTLPQGQSGTRYFYVRTNLDSAFRETNANNNTSAAAATIFAAATPADLVVTSVQTTDTVVTAFQSVIQYTVANNGTGAASGSRVDSLYISCNPVFNAATAFYIGKKVQTNSIPAGGNFTDTLHVKIPFTYYINNCFTQTNFNNGYFFIKTNANGAVYEGANTNNNVNGSGLKVLDNPLVDHTVTSVNGADSATVGQPYNIASTVKNLGRNPVIDYGNRSDSVYISVDSVLNSNAIPFTRFYWSNRLEKNQSITLSNNFNFINVPAGFYYVFVIDNARKEILAEKNYSNNVNLMRNAGGAAKKIYVTHPLLPDLTDSIISAPATVATGQPITVVHRIKNIGSAQTSPNHFYHSISLANDVAGVFIAYNLTVKYLRVTLQPGQYIDDTIQCLIPNNAIPRNYVVFSKTDAYVDITEANENNNSSISFINVYRPDPSELMVQYATAPDTVVLGYRMDSARWSIKNNSAITAMGNTADGIYLSQAAQFDSAAILIGIKTRNINLLPLVADTLAYAPLVTGVTEGLYNMFVRTDILDQIPETDETNNTNVSAAQVFVKVKELKLNIVENNTLFTDTRFYKLIIPDSLNGATISVKLTTGDSLTRINQMFMGYGYVPTAAHFDYTYPTANYGNQDIVMTYTVAGTYYISIRTVNPGNVTQNISLLAKKLPFAISNVHTNSGGNIGNVTIKISGSLFTPGMTAKLNKPGTEIIASAVYYTNTTVVYATFNLQGKPLGIYDVTLSKADTAFAVLSNGFSVVPANNGGLITGGGNNTGGGNGNQPGCDPGAASGLNSQLVIELLVPERVLRGWPFVITVNYNNPTNFDVPAQIRSLYAEDIIKMALTPQGVANGVHSLTLEVTGQEGPPGIIRAGGSGTIFIYGKSDNDVLPHTITIFRLL